MSTPPLSSSSSSASTPSPKSEPFQLNADESLELLLQAISNHGQNVDASGSPDGSQLTTPPELGQLSTWANSGNANGKLDFGDFNFSLPMDLDFDQNMAIDPNSLHFDSIFDTNTLSLPDGTSFLMPPQADMSGDLVYPTSDDMSWMPQSHIQPDTGRRLSVTSSSSSSASGASLSPVSEPASVSSSPPSHSCLSDPAQELADKVRQMAGVTWAVPVSAQVQQMAAAGGQAKLPIPRLPRPNPAVMIKNSPKTPPTSEFASSPKSEGSSEGSTPPPVQSVIGRPKTSHTTIERRYRTNLNARITGLKQAVPALRVLEAKVNAQENPYGDVVDSRGFVDGVKVARKMSKANVLGKAAEYIKVLKKREARLKREQDGLKSLVSGLVGGPALLKEWEREWRERFGGEEKDELEEEGAAAASDDEDGDGEDSDGEDGEEGRARKKPKVAKPVKKEKPSKPAAVPQSVVSTVSGVAPEKRKRGRPRKVPLPPVSAAPTPLAPAAPVQPAPATAPPIFPVDTQMQDNIVQTQSDNNAQQAHAQQYLLAVFAFFSVFSSPLASSRSQAYPAHPHAHHGQVLTPHVPPYSEAPPVVPASSFDISAIGWYEAVQAAHLLVSTLVFFYVLVPWLSGTLRRFRGRLALSQFLARARATCMPSSMPDPLALADGARIGKPRAHHQAALMDSLVDALDPAHRGSADEAVKLRRALGVMDGFVGLMQGVIKAGRVDRGIELNQLEQRAWVRLGELVAFNDQVGKATRLQTYWCMSWHISTFAAQTKDLATLALIMRPVSSTKAAALWEAARKPEVIRPYEKIVLDNMSVDDAAEWLAKWQRWHETERKGRCAACEKRTPLGVLAAILIRARLRKHAAALFVRTVVRDEVRAAASGDCAGDSDAYIYDAEKDLCEEHERRETVEAGKSIGGRTAELAVLLERIWHTGFFTHEDVLLPTSPTGAGGRDEDVDCEDMHDLASTDEAEIRALLSATIIYRRIFPSSFPACATSVAFILSPPPSPSQRNAALHMALRTSLGSPAFEYGSGGKLEDEELTNALEEARDRVNDMLVELEKSCRRAVRHPVPVHASH